MEVLSRNPDLRYPMEEARQFLQLFDTTGKDVLTSRIGDLKKRIDQTIDGGEMDTPKDATPVIPPTKIPGSNFPFYMVAASVTMLLLAAFAIFYYRPWVPALTLGTDGLEQVTPKGRRTMITLDDGTHVWMNADSKLTYPKKFEGATREVFLQGEAFFDVTENVHKPFVVQTSSIRVRVLGTAFNVRSYEHDDQVKTTLVRGKVVIEPAGDSTRQVTLLPQQQAVYEKQSKKIILENQVDTDRFTSWREGRLLFEDQPLSAIVEELERWYNVNITVEDQGSLGCRFSAKVNNKTLEEVLELFKASDGIEYVIAGKDVQVKGKLCDE
jgi:ferric-dicitrate binding protein FerR (iron transport regulator)